MALAEALRQDDQLLSLNLKHNLISDADSLWRALCADPNDHIKLRHIYLGKDFFIIIQSLHEIANARNF